MIHKKAMADLLDGFRFDPATVARFEVGTDDFDQYCISVEGVDRAAALLRVYMDGKVELVAADYSAAGEAVVGEVPPFASR